MSDSLFKAVPVYLLVFPVLVSGFSLLPSALPVAPQRGFKETLGRYIAHAMRATMR